MPSRPGEIALAARGWTERAISPSGAGTNSPTPGTRRRLLNLSRVLLRGDVHGSWFSQRLLCFRRTHLSCNSMMWFRR